MKKIILILIVMFPYGAGFCGSFSPVEHTYATLLISNDGELIEVGAKSIYYENNKNTHLLDIVAEVLWLSIQQGVRADKRLIKYNSRSEEDTVSWLAKALGNSGLGRYQSVLKESFELAESKKLKKYIKQASDALGKYDGDFYQPGNISLDTVRQSLESPEYKNPGKAGSAEFSTIKNGKTLDEVYAALGLPDELSMGFRRIYRPAVFIYHPLLRVQYLGGGIVEFDHANNKDKKWMVSNVFKPIDIGIRLLEEDDLAMIKQSLLIQEGSIVRKTAQKIYKQRLFGADVLDVAAERIYHSLNDSDKELSDGMAWIFKSIAASKNGCYRYVTEYVINNSKNSKLVKYARKALNGLPSDSECVYKKGDITAKYATQS